HATSTFGTRSSGSRMWSKAASIGCRCISRKSRSPESLRLRWGRRIHAEWLEQHEVEVVAQPGRGRAMPAEADGQVRHADTRRIEGPRRRAGGIAQRHDLTWRI